jgi:nucleoside-diphosphate-sugar epimerase
VAAHSPLYLVTGASGWLGSRVVAALAAAELCATTRWVYFTNSISR